jgi:hypothetical protein
MKMVQRIKEKYAAASASKPQRSATSPHLASSSLSKASSSSSPSSPAKKGTPAADEDEGVDFAKDEFWISSANKMNRRSRIQRPKGQ